MINYDDLDKHYTLPKIDSFYDKRRIPRKLKKKVKKFCGECWDKLGLNNGQRLWRYLDISNPDYKRFLIKKICEEYNSNL